MTRKPLSGIDGVLGNLLSASPRNAGRGHEARPTADGPPKATMVTPRPANDNSVHVRGARLGRPFGTRANANRPREKVTVQIATSLIAEYRDQSWEARCSLSRLVEKALSEYRRQFRD